MDKSITDHYNFFKYIVGFLVNCFFFPSLITYNMLLSHLRNRKHVPCFYRSIESRVKVWENEKYCGNTSRRRVFPQPFRVLPNFYEFLPNLHLKQFGANRIANIPSTNSYWKRNFNLLKVFDVYLLYKFQAIQRIISVIHKANLPSSCIAHRSLQYQTTGHGLNIGQIN